MHGLGAVMTELVWVFGVVRCERYIHNYIYIIILTFNLFNNQSFVQFLHRNIAYLIVLLTLFIGIKLFFEKNIKFLNNYLAVFFVLTIQVFLGIFTLISGLNLYLASLHQITSVILVFTILNLNHKLS